MVRSQAYRLPPIFSVQVTLFSLTAGYLSLGGTGVAEPLSASRMPRFLIPQTTAGRRFLICLTDDGILAQRRSRTELSWSPLAGRPATIRMREFRRSTILLQTHGRS